MTLYCGLMKTYTLKESTPMKSWISCIGKAEVIFKMAILPELLGNFFSRQPKNPTIVFPSLSDEPGPSTSTAAESYCYCRGLERDDMIACDNPTCPYVWFHFDWLKLSTTPRTKQWFCPECRKLPQHLRKRGRQTDNDYYTSLY